MTLISEMADSGKEVMIGEIAGQELSLAKGARAASPMGGQASIGKREQWQEARLIACLSDTEKEHIGIPGQYWSTSVSKALSMWRLPRYSMSNASLR